MIFEVKGACSDNCTTEETMQKVVKLTQNKISSQIKQMSNFG